MLKKFFHFEILKECFSVLLYTIYIIYVNIKNILILQFYNNVSVLLQLHEKYL